jgi:hypothetical protein
MGMRTKKTKQDRDDRAGDDRACSVNIHLQITPALASDMYAAWRASDARSRNDWIRRAIADALETTHVERQ